jgi:hypothetical protein
MGSFSLEGASLDRALDGTMQSHLERTNLGELELVVLELPASGIRLAICCYSGRMLSLISTRSRFCS